MCPEKAGVCDSEPFKTQSGLSDSASEATSPYWEDYGTSAVRENLVLIFTTNRRGRAVSSLGKDIFEKRPTRF